MKLLLLCFLAAVLIVLCEGFSESKSCSCMKGKCTCEESKGKQSTGSSAFNGPSGSKISALISDTIPSMRRSGKKVMDITNSTTITDRKGSVMQVGYTRTIVPLKKAEKKQLDIENELTLMMYGILKEEKELLRHSTVRPRTKSRRAKEHKKLSKLAKQALMGSKLKY